MPASSPRYANDPALLSLGAAIRRLRLAQGISQEELAYRCVIDRAYMSSIERGQQNAGVMTLLGIAAALNMKAAELLEEAQL